MKLIHFCLFLPYWEKSKTFPGDTKVRTTWILSDAIQKSPSRNLLSQRRKERGNKQDLFLKTETFMHLKAGREVEQSKSEKGWLDTPFLSALELELQERKSPVFRVNFSWRSQASGFVFLNLFFNSCFCLLNTCLSNFCNHKLAHLHMVCFKHSLIAH